MACFRVNLSAYGETVDETKLKKWAGKFFTNYSWQKPILTGRAQEADYLVRQLRSLLTNNLKNWGSKSSKRYNAEWIKKISPWEMAQSDPASKLVAEHRLHRLAALLTAKAAGMRALKANAEPELAKMQLRDAEKQYEEFDKEFDDFKRRWGYEGNPNGYEIMKNRERTLIVAVCLAQKRVAEAAESSPAKRARTA